MADTESKADKKAQKNFDGVVMSIMEASHKRVLRIKVPKIYYPLFFYLDKPSKLLGN